MPMPDMPAERLARYEEFFAETLRHPPAELAHLLRDPALAAHFRPLMLAGWWLEEELTALGCEREERRRLCFAHGQRSLGRDTWDVAAAVLERYRAGISDNPGAALANALLGNGGER